MITFFVLKSTESILCYNRFFPFFTLLNYFCVKKYQEVIKNNCVKKYHPKILWNMMVLEPLKIDIYSINLIYYTFNCPTIHFFVGLIMYSFAPNFNTNNYFIRIYIFLLMLERRTTLYLLFIKNLKNNNKAFSLI